ncbi:MAG: hypothetical protein AAFY72_14770 [Cyanobacteria bacterium J06649_4]
MNVKGMLGFLAFAGAGIWVTGFTPPVEAAIVQSSRSSTDTAQTIQLTQTIDSASAVIETQLTPQPDGTVTGEATFTGNANETIVIYIPRRTTLPSYNHRLTLYNSAEEEISIGYGYPDFDPFRTNGGGTYRVISLPETGTYRLTFEGQIRNTDDSDTSASEPDYVMQVRNATYYERLVIAAEELFEDDQADRAFELWALAIADSPDQPTAYMHRLFARAEQVYSSPEFQTKIQAAFAAGNSGTENVDIFPLIHETFLTLSAEEQSLSISDLRQLDRLVSEAIASGELDPNEDDVPPILFSGIAEFLETGEPTDIVIQLLFGTAQATAEPVIASPEEATPEMP